MTWTGWYPVLWSSPGLYGHTYIYSAEVATNLTMIVLVSLFFLGLGLCLHSTCEL